MSYHITRAIRNAARGNAIRVANAIEAIGYVWPKQRPTSIDALCRDLPRVDLERVLNHLKRP